VPYVADDFDLARDLAAAGASRSACWRFIERYAATWLTPLDPAAGYSANDLNQAEDRLGVRLPPSLREGYEMFARRDELVRRQDHLLAPSELCFDEDRDALIFRIENQSVTSWGIPANELTMADPPVVYLRTDLGRPGWHPYLDRFSLACVEMALSESMLGSDISDNRPLDEATVNILERRFERLSFPDYPLWANPDGPSTRWFGDDDVLLRDDCRDWLWVHARNVTALHRVRATLPGEWLMADRAVSG
jgi:hypothetical protein